MMVHLNWATISPIFSTKTGYWVSNSCSQHSLTPTLAMVESSKPLIAKGRVGYFLFTNAKKVLADFSLQAVLSINFSFVNSGSEFSFLGLTFAWWDKHIKTKHISWHEFIFFNLLFRCLFIDDNIIAINEVLLHFMWKNSFNCIHSVCFTYFCNSLSHTSVSSSFFYESLSSLESVVCS